MNGSATGMEVTIVNHGNPESTTNLKPSQPTETQNDNPQPETSIGRPLVAIEIHPDWRPNWTQKKCYIKAVDDMNVIHEFSIPFNKALGWFATQFCESSELSSITINAIRALLDAEESPPTNYRENLLSAKELNSEFTKVMSALRKLASMECYSRAIHTFNLEITPNRDPYRDEEDDEFLRIYAETPLEYYFDIVTNWTDTLRHVGFLTQGLAYVQWAAFFNPNQIVHLRLDIAGYSFEPLRAVVAPHSEKAYPLKTLSLGFDSRPAPFSLTPYDPLIHIIRDLSPTSYFCLNLTNHWGMMRYIFEQLAKNDPPSAFQTRLRFLELGPDCCSTMVDEGMLGAFKNLVEVRSIRLHPALLNSLGNILAQDDEGKERDRRSIDLLLQCRPANDGHKIFNRAMAEAYKMRTNPRFRLLKIQVHSPGEGYLAEIVLSHKLQTITKRRRVVLTVRRTRELESADTQNC